ncbi:helix-turn-helix domain-containing protein [Streptomyces sp. NPDC048172]|uniref:helix-turn-helix domain-containing protein n=1 Tax=Streptomyces sp. NPDC048172 TaxID=3365505 RepID=UPI00370FF55C
MVNNGHATAEVIPDLPYAPPPGVSAGVEVMTLAELRTRSRAKGQVMSDPQRPGFHQLFALDEGTLRQTVDFAEYELTPGSWLWVRPGQVQQHGNLAAGEGTLVLFQSGFLDPATASAARLDEAFGPARWRPGGTATRLALEHLHREFVAFTSTEAPAAEAHRAVLRHLLAALLLRITGLTPGPEDGGPPDTRPGETFVRFRAAVERDFARTRQVADYARALGYSPRTLSRATRAAAGVGAKEFVDRRVLLEAQRLLAHSDEPAATVASRLGFADATNFSKFFHHRAGQTPGTFRAEVRGEG